MNQSSVHLLVLTLANQASLSVTLLVKDVKDEAVRLLSWFVPERCFLSFSDSNLDPLTETVSFIQPFHTVYYQKLVG